MLRCFLFLGALGCVGAFRAEAQIELYMHRNLQRAYDKGTRSMDGKPGPGYWQNRARYDIDARVDVKKRQISGNARIVYYNNSPDTLRTLRFKLQHDRYRKGALRSSNVNPADVSDEGTRIARVTFRGRLMGKDEQRRNATFMDLRLGNDFIAPGDSARIEIKWAYTAPGDKRATRECFCDPHTFFIPYWYPQIAVYDDLRGWAPTPYAGQQEFYHDFADYDVRIALPKGYMVWATGEWQNAAQMLRPAFLEKWKAAHLNDEVVSIFTEAEIRKGAPFLPLKEHVFHYIARDVPDFTFAGSNHYNWDAASVEVDPISKRRTLVNAAYNTASQDFYKVCQIARDGIRLMSTWQPGYPFPYPSMTVFNGNDGMEYPMMVNDASVSMNAVTGLTVHEVAHTYFPFMMGINEQEYAWMDEGWASFFDFLLTDTLTGGKQGNVRGYGMVAGTDFDVPPMARSSFLSGQAYRIASYTRPQAAYLTLLDQLGYETFHRCMVAYMDRWKSKHPMPYDFFYTWNDVSGQNLDWFWKPWFFEWGYPDLALAGIEQMADGTEALIVEKVGALPVPMRLEMEYLDGSKEVVKHRPEIWKDGKTKFAVILPRNKTLRRIQLGGRTIPDSNPQNNSWSR